MSAVLPTLDEIEALIRRVVREELGARAGLLTTEEAAEVADVQPKTIREWVRTGRLHVEKRRGRRMFLREEDVLAARANAPADPAGATIDSLRARSG